MSEPIYHQYVVVVHFGIGDHTIYMALAENKKAAIQSACEHFSDCAVSKIECFTEEEVYANLSK